MNNGLLQTSNTLSFTPNKTHHSFFSIQFPKHKFLSFHVKIPTVSPVFASKTPTTPEIRMPQTDKFHLQDEFDEEFEEEDDDEEEDIIVPLKNMREWTQNKPLGFGEGKVYDTSIEDKLMEELEQSRVAQLANVDNLKNNPQDGNPNSKKPKLLKQKDSEVAPNGIRVRLVHLPKKKNIHRDLHAAFKPFSGITNIIPAVSGNEKTREPVCKGFAFVDFKSEKDAKRFVDLFSTQPITFGKVQKQIKCEIMKLSSPIPTLVKPVHKTEKPLPISYPDVAVNLNPATEIPFDSYVDDELVSVANDYNDDDNLTNVVQGKQEPETGSESSKKQKKVGEKGKKMTMGKRKGENTPKLNIPGSANRLKMKEKALLSGVFSKYGGKAAMAAKGKEMVSDQVQ